DTSAFEKEVAPAPSAAANPGAPQIRSKYGAQQSAQTIDALFAPLPTVESRGRAWLFMNKQLIPKNLRLGISDGTNTELLSTELEHGMGAVTGVTGLGSTRALPADPGKPLTRRGGGAGRPGGGGRGRQDQSQA